MSKVLILGLTVVVFAGCGPGNLLLNPTSGGTSDYGDELDDWTITQNIYDSFETRAVVHATFYSPRFIGAYLDEYRRIYRPTDEEFALVKEKMEGRARRADCFFMAAFTGNRDWNDFALSGSIWRVYLVTSDGRKLKSMPIREVKDSNQIYHHFFPYFDPFYEGYEVCFSESVSKGADSAGMIHAEMQWFEFQLLSPIGEMQFRWNLKR